MFDSLSPLLLHQPSPVVTRLLHGISESDCEVYCCLMFYSDVCCQNPGHHCRLVVSLVHADLHEDHVINQLCHVTSTSITIQPLTIHTDEPYKCSIQHKRKSGKVAIQASLLSNVFTTCSVVFLCYLLTVGRVRH